MAHYFIAHATPSPTDPKNSLIDHTPIGRSALELGSGNGFLSCVLSRCCPSLRITVTDVGDHVRYIDEVISHNSPHISPSNVTAEHYDWATGWSNSRKFDFLYGTDVAYRDYLWDPLINALDDLSHRDTVVLLGITMEDTKSGFFERLTTRGWRYTKVNAARMNSEFRGPEGGLFVLRRRQK